jgi:hypothetical protein
VERYRLTNSEDFAATPSAKGRGRQFKISNPLPAPGIELIVLKEN